MMQSWTRHLKLPLEEGEKSGWKPYWLFKGPTPAMTSLTCHVSVLSSGRVPHPPHSHPEEELLLVLDGLPDLLIASESGSIVPHQGSPGDLVYYPGGQLHTIRNRASGPATYLMFKWTNSRSADEPGRLGTQLHRCALAYPGGNESGKRSWKTARIFEGRTQWLHRLQCHVTRIAPGGGYEPHRDNYDVAVVVTAGTVETLGVVLEPSDVAFFATGELHGMRNIGDADASYIVIEFERPPG